MTITIDLPVDIETALRKKASADGQDFQIFVLETLKTKAFKPSLNEILAPVRKNFADSGMTEEELDELIETERQSIWEEKTVNDFNI
jgi:hypothetical protein